MRPSIVARLALSAVVAGLYIAACVTPAIDNPAPATRDFGDITPYGTVPGIVALLFGSMSETIIAWSANPLLLTAWILLLFKRNTLAVWLGAAAAAAGLSTVFILPAPMKVLVGYYLWQGSLIAFALGALAIKYWEQGPNRRKVQSGERVSPSIADDLATR